MVFRMIHVKDFLVPRDKVWSLDFLGKTLIRIFQVLAFSSHSCCLLVDFDQGSLIYPFRGKQAMKVYGDFEGSSSKSALFGW